MKEIALFLLFAASVGTTFAEDTVTSTPFSFVFSPSMIIPLGPGARVFSLGGSGKLTAEYAPPALNNLSLQLGLLYNYQTLQAAAGSTSVIAVLTGAAWRFPIVGGLSARAFAGTGYSFGFINGGSLSNGGTGALGEAGAGLAFAFSQTLALRLDLSYLYYFGLYGGLNASLALSVTPPPPKTIILPSKPKLMDLEIEDITLQSVFPIFHTWYDQNPVGKVEVKNTGKEPITNVNLSFFIKQYMDGPKECASIAELKPGEAREVALYALFNNSVLDITEATKAISQIDAAYTEAGEKLSESKTATIRIYNRNAMTWDDDRKAAAFVSGKDPWVLDFSNNVTAMVKELFNPNINRNFQLAIAFHDALRLYGMSYTPNPTTPYSQTSKNPEIVDFLKFPRQTLSYRAGDCSDLSILYASFFESVGVDTAFITVPGHIFMAISLGVTPEEAKANVTNYGDLIIQNGKAWLPIETTVRDQGLLAAWREGAREWKESAADNTAAFYLVHDAWKLFEPVGLAADNTTVKVPASDLVTQTFASELSKYAQQELSARTSVINDSMAITGETANGLNKRGVIYAKYGRLDLAELDFRAAIKKEADYVPSLVNLGNLAWLNHDAQGALAYYRRAAEVVPNSAKVLLNLALAASTLGNDKDASAAYESAKSLDPDLAAKYSFIAGKGSTETRAAQANTNGVLWDEE